MKLKSYILLISSFISFLFLTPIVRADPIVLPNSKTVINFIINLAVIYFIAATFEFIIIYICFRFTIFKNEIIPYKLYFAVLLINLCSFLPTQIYAWFFFFNLSSFFFMYIILIEVLVVIFESMLLLDKLEKWISKYLASKREKTIILLKILIIANFGSFWIGFLQFGLYPPIFYIWPLTIVY